MFLRLYITHSPYYVETMLKMLFRWFGLTGLFFLLAAGVVPAQEEVFQASIGADGSQHVDVVAGNYFFNPNHIIVKANVPVRMTIRKEGGIVPHDIVLNAPEAGVDFKEELGRDAKTITFVATKPGTYTFFCDKKPPFGKSHRERGMIGVLEVVE